MLKKYIPFLDWIGRYRKDDAKGDFNAGLTVGVMLIPQGMAYAILAGMPPVYGLYASIVPLIIYTFLGTSRHVAVGPVAMVSLLVMAGVGEFAEPGSDVFIRMAILTALGVGLTQFFMGLFRVGFLVNFLSHPVLSGFTSAAAIIIGASQIGNLLGLSLPRSKFVPEILYEAGMQLSNINPYTAAIGIGSIVIIQLLRKWKRAFPSALVVVILGTLVTGLAGLQGMGVSIVGDIPQGLPAFDAGFLVWSDFGQLLPLILVISLVSYMESVAVAKALANKHGYKIDPNQELIGLGAANIGGSFFQSFSVTGGFSRSAVNSQAGARTPMATLISAGVIALTVLFLTPLFYYLPSAVLAAIIMVAVAGLFDSAEIKHLWHTDRLDLAMFGITFIATLGLGIEQGIAIGAVVSLVAVIYQSSRPHSAELGQLGKTNVFRNLERYEKARQVPGLLIFRFDAQLYFANIEYFRNEIEQRIKLRNEAGDAIDALLLDFGAVSNIDSSGIHAIEDLLQDLDERGIKVLFSGVIGPVRDRFHHCGLLKALGSEAFFFDVQDGVKYHEEGRRPEYDFSVLQTNTRTAKALDSTS